MKRLNGHREEFERKADQLREKLLHTIDAIDQRRHTLLDVKYQVRRHAGAASLAGVLLVAASGVLLAATAYRTSTRDSRLRRERAQAFARFWRHPDRVASPDKGSVPSQIARRLVIGTATFVAMELIRRVVRRALMLPAREVPARRRPLALGA